MTRMFRLLVPVVPLSAEGLASFATRMVKSQKTVKGFVFALNIRQTPVSIRAAKEGTAVQLD